MVEVDVSLNITEYGTLYSPPHSTQILLPFCPHSQAKRLQSGGHRDLKDVKEKNQSHMGPDSIINPYPALVTKTHPVRHPPALCTVVASGTGEEKD